MVSPFIENTVNSHVEKGTGGLERALWQEGIKNTTNTSVITTGYPI